MNWDETDDRDYDFWETHGPFYEGSIFEEDPNDVAAFNALVDEAEEDDETYLQGYCSVGREICMSDVGTIGDYMRDIKAHSEVCPICSYARAARMAARQMQSRKTVQREVGKVVKDLKDGRAA